MGLPLGAAARVLGGGSVLPHATFPSEDDAVAADVLGEWGALLVVCAADESLAFDLALWHQEGAGGWKESNSGGTVYGLEPGVDRPPERWWSESPVWVGSVIAVTTDDGWLNVAGGFVAPDVVELQVAGPAERTLEPTTDALRSWVLLWTGDPVTLTAVAETGETIGEPVIVGMKDLEGRQQMATGWRPRRQQ